MEKKNHLWVKPRAFTLIELLVVIAVIAVLMAILMPSLRMAREQAQRSVCANNLRSMAMGVFTYSADYNEKLPPSFYQNGYSPYRCYMLFEVDTSKPWGEHIYKIHNLGRLFTGNYIKTGKAFYCPSAPKVTDTGGTGAQYYKAYLNGEQRWPWINTHRNDSGGQGDNVRGSYNYVPQSKHQKKTVNGGTRTFPTMAKSTLKLDPGAAIVTDYFNNLNALAHKRGLKGGGGLNVLYGDGSLQFRNDSDAFDPILWEKSINTESGEFGFRTILEKLEQ